MLAGSCGHDKQKKTCLFNLANHRQGPWGPHRCPPASEWGKELTLLEYSLFSRVLFRPPVILAVTRADGHRHLTVTGEETEAESQGFAQGQDRRVSQCMLGGIMITRSLGVQLLFYGCLIYSTHLPIPYVTPHSQFPVISVLNRGQGQSRRGHLKEADMSRKQPSHLSYTSFYFTFKFLIS